MDKSTGISEPTVILIPGLDYRPVGQLDPWRCDRVKAEMRRKTANMQADIDAFLKEHLPSDSLQGDERE